MPSFDQFGNPVAAAPDPAWGGRFDLDRLQDRVDLQGVLADINPAKLRTIFADADNGMIGGQIELAEVIEERDAHLSAVLEIRRRAVLGIEWQIQPGAEDARATQAADAFREVWESLDGQGLLERLQMAVLPQWHVEQVLWEADGRVGGRRMWRPVAIEEVDGRKLAYPMTAREMAGDLTLVTPGLMRNWNPSDLEPLHAGRFICHAYRARRGRPGRMALVRAIAFLWMLKRFGWVDFATLLEQFGRPWRAVKYDQSVSAEKLKELLGVLKAASADLAIAIPKGSELEFFQGMTSVGQNPHTDMLKLVDEAESKLIVGSTTIADAAQNSESVSSPTHANVRRDIRDADCRALAATLQRDLLAPWTLWNFGAETIAPKLVPTLGDRPDPEKRGAVFAIARNQLRLRLKSEQVYRELGLEAPADTPEILEPEAPMAEIVPTGQPNGNDNDELKRKDAKDAEQDAETEGRRDRGTES